MNDDFRRTFLRSKNSNIDSLPKKKNRASIKLPSVKLINPDVSGYHLGELIGEGGFAKVRYCTRKKDG